MQCLCVRVCDCVAVHCVALHCIALHCIALRCIALRCVALHISNLQNALKVATKGLVSGLAYSFNDLISTRNLDFTCVCNSSMYFSLDD